MYKLFSAKTNILTLTSSAVFRLQTGLKIVLVCFHISWGNEVDFKDMMYVSPKILFLDQNFKKLRHCFLDERATITTILISVCHWKTLVLFVFKKKQPENTFLKLTVNYRKIIQKKTYLYAKQNSGKLTN